MSEPATFVEIDVGFHAVLMRDGYALLPVRTELGRRWAKVDAGDYERCRHYTWSVDSSGVLCAQSAVGGRAGRKVKVTLARFILNDWRYLTDYKPCRRVPGAVQKITQRNGDPLDFRRANLRPLAKRKGGRGTYRRPNGKWFSQVALPHRGTKDGSRVRKLGDYDTEAEAARAYAYAVQWIDDGVAPPNDWIGNRVRRAIGMHIEWLKIDRG